MTDRIQIRVVDRLADFERLRPAWTELVSRGRSSFVFMTWEWCYTWWQHFAGDRQLFILVVSRGDEPIGIIPLMRYVRPNVVHEHRRCLHFIGFRPEQRWNDWMDFPTTDKPAAIPAALRYLAGHQHLWDVLDLWDIPEDSETIQRLESTAQGRGLPCLSERGETCPFVDTTGNWEQYYQTHIARDVRNDLERQIRRLTERGNLEVHWPDSQSLPAHLELLFDFRNRRQAARSQANLYSEKQYQDFYRALATRFPLAELDCPVLTVNSVPAAVHFGFRFGSRLHYCTPGFDPDLKAYSPGKVLLKRILEQCFADPAITVFDFLRGDEPYKYEWATGECRASRITITAPYALGFGGKLFRRLPVPLRRLQTLCSKPSS